MLGYGSKPSELQSFTVQSTVGVRLPSTSSPVRTVSPAPGAQTRFTSPTCSSRRSRSSSVKQTIRSLSSTSLLLVDHASFFHYGRCTDSVPPHLAELPSDNLSVDSAGAVWAAAMPKSFHRITKHFFDPTIPSPSAALRITLNTGKSAFFGEKYKILKAFEDDGRIASGATTMVYDADRERLFLSGEYLA
jgi:hypothetical protein